MKRTLFLLSCLAISANTHAQITQNVLLEPGWNSVYLEVQPEDNEITSVFAGVPLVSIWRFFDADGVTGVPENPSDGLAQLDGWHAFYFPEDSPQASFSDLFTVRANNAYLINLGGTGNVTVEITGMPVVEERRWAPDAFTFTGFSVEPLIPPTFTTWFSGSTSHLNQPIYRLNDSDQWELVNPGARIEPGVGYWVFSRGASEYSGPLEVMLDPGFRDLDFGKDIPQTGVTLINRAQTTQDIRVARASGGQRVPLEYQDTSDPQAQFPPWVPFEQAFPARLTPGGSTRLVVAPRREDLQFNRAEQVLIFSNLDGARVRIPTAAELPVYDVSLPDGSSDGPPVGAAATPRAGLWVGTATIMEVNQTQVADGNVDSNLLFPVAQPWPLRVIVHINADGDLSLVSQVVQLFEEGSTQEVFVPETSTTEERVCVPGRTVLITEDERFSEYSGLQLRGDGFVGSRLSTVAYDFGEAEDRKVHDKSMTWIGDQGGPAPQNAWEVTVTSEPDSASNPFFHPFHPDHDNRDEFYEPYVVEMTDPPVPDPVEVPRITRSMYLYFCDTPGVFDNGDPWDPAGNEACRALSEPAGGVDVLAGKFEDRIDEGLHTNPIRARGDFRLRRLARESELNPEALDLDTCICDHQGGCP